LAVVFYNAERPVYTVNKWACHPERAQRSEGTPVQLQSVGQRAAREFLYSRSRLMWKVKMTSFYFLATCYF